MLLLSCTVEGVASVEDNAAAEVDDFSFSCCIIVPFDIICCWHLGNGSSSTYPYSTEVGCGVDDPEVDINLASPAGEASSPMVIFHTGALFVICMVEDTPSLSVLADGIIGGNVLDAHRPVCAVTAGGVTVLGRARYNELGVLS